MTHAKPASGTSTLGPEVYARWRGSGLGAITDRIERRLIGDLIGDIAGRALLDIGCGDGELAVELSRRGAAVTGIDASAAMIRAAKERAARENANVAFEAAAADRLPFGPEQFDLVTAITILCFVEEAAPVFQEIARVLRPGGRLVVGELGKWSLWAAGRRIRGWFGSPLWRHGQFRTAKELAGLAQGAGLTVEQVRGAVYYPRSHVAALLLSRFDAALGRLTTIGAGFVAISAIKSTAAKAKDISPPV